MHSCVYSEPSNKLTIITFSNLDTGEFFFSTSHLQRVRASRIPHGEHWVSCTAELPMFVVPRPGLEDGMIGTVSEYIMIFYSDLTRIANPDPNYESPQGIKRNLETA